MIEISVLTFGKNKDNWLTEGLAHYVKLLNRFAHVSFRILPEPKQAASLPTAELLKQEATSLLKNWPLGTCLALTDSGKKFDSPKFAAYLERTLRQKGSKVTFVIGGAYGLHESVLSKADDTISLSQLTFSHQLVRLVLLEQLYRAFSIFHGTGYHK